MIDSTTIASAEVVVVGSVHMDLIARAPRLPKPGESLTGDRYLLLPGGKAGNQAIAAAQQGAATAIVARVGPDAFGRELRRALQRKLVDVGLLQIDAEMETGLCPVLMSESGEYATVIVPGASVTLSPDRLVPAETTLASCRVLLLQLEIHHETSVAAARIAKDSGAVVMLNAAPAIGSGSAALKDLFPLVDVMIVNQHEARALMHSPTGELDDGAGLASFIAHAYCIPTVIVTLGAMGAVCVTSEGILHVPAIKVPVIDTIGAGDVFAGVIAAALARGDGARESLQLAVAAGAMAVQREGAFDAAPTLQETRALAELFA